MKDYQPGLLSHGGKFVLLFNLIQECLAMEDKVLVFRYMTCIHLFCYCFKIIEIVLLLKQGVKN